MDPFLFLRILDELGENGHEASLESSLQHGQNLFSTFYPMQLIAMRLLFWLLSSFDM